MNKYIFFLTVFLGMISGFYLGPHLMLSYIGGCESESIFINSKESVSAVTKGNWVYNRGLSHALYSASVKIQGKGAELKLFMLEEYLISPIISLMTRLK